MFEQGVDFNPYPLYQDAYEAAFADTGELFHQLADLPKNTLSKEEVASWEKAKKIKEAFQRLKNNPDFQLYKQVCHRKWVYQPYVKPDLSFTEEAQKRAFIRYHQQLVIMQINSDFNHYANMEPPPVDEAKGK